MGETILVRGEGGVIIPMDLPLPESIADRLTKGYLTRVNEDGSAYTEPTEDDEPSGPPAKSAHKPEWVGYAVREHGLSPDEAEALTKDDLIEKFGQAES